MPQVFPKSMNVVARLTVLGLPLVAASGAVAGTAFYRSDYTTGAREVLEQPIPFSHKHHSGQLGIGCQYCHPTAEVSYHGGFPPTKTCMNCHQQMWTGADVLAPVRESYKTDTPIVWNQVHNLPHYTYFNHSIHTAKGVGCYSCHGRMDEMNLTFQTKTLLMEWCLQCHRNPEQHLRPRSEIYNQMWKPEDGATDTDGTVYERGEWTQLTLGKHLKEKYQVRDHHVITNCSICHR